MASIYPHASSEMRFPLLAIGMMCLGACSERAVAPTHTQAHVYTPEAAVAENQPAQAFVQDFYDWYSQQAMHSQPRLTDAALASAQWPMSKEIQDRLKVDQEARERSPDDTVGIDFDPFLNAHYPCYPYKAGPVMQEGGRVRVALSDACANTHPGGPDVIAEMEQRDGKWMFVDFIYPGEAGEGDKDLLASLKVPSAMASLQSAGAFAQGFYDWYTQQAKNSQPGLIDAALANTQWPVSDELAAALRADEEASERSPDEVVGLDFDPFLNTQDPCYPYEAGKVTQEGGRVRVAFTSACEDAHRNGPDVIAEMEQRDGKWMFVNFIYPGDPGQADNDLLGTLKALKEERDNLDHQED